jgi:hypothetical protein
MSWPRVRVGASSFAPGYYRNVTWWLGRQASNSRLLTIQPQLINSLQLRTEAELLVNPDSAMEAQWNKRTRCLSLYYELRVNSVCQCPWSFHPALHRLTHVMP